jgi:hypothetical protein
VAKGHGEHKVSTKITKNGSGLTKDYIVSHLSGLFSLVAQPVFIIKLYWLMNLGNPVKNHLADTVRQLKIACRCGRYLVNEIIRG